MKRAFFFFIIIMKTPSLLMAECQGVNRLATSLTKTCKQLHSWQNGARQTRNALAS